MEGSTSQPSTPPRPERPSQEVLDLTAQMIGEPLSGSGLGNPQQQQQQESGPSSSSSSSSSALPPVDNTPSFSSLKTLLTALPPTDHTSSPPPHRFVKPVYHLALATIDEENDDDDELEYADDAPPLPGVPSEFLPSGPTHLYGFKKDLSRHLGDEFNLSTTIGKQPESTTTAIDPDDRPVPPTTAGHLASSLRRRLNMLTMFKSRNQTAAFTGAQGSGGDHAGEGEQGEGSLARRLFGSHGEKKKKQRPDLPEGWLFGPPPE